MMRGDNSSLEEPQPALLGAAGAFSSRQAAEVALTARSISDTGYAPLVLDRLTCLACRTAGAEQGCILVYDRNDPRTLVATAVEGLDEDVIGRRLGPDEDVVARVLASSVAASFSDPRGIPLGVGELLGREPGSGAYAPIKRDGVSQGAIVVARSRRGRRCAPRELDVLGAVADVAGAALGHAEAREPAEEAIRSRVETLATALELRDKVTGRHVNEVVELALEVGERLELDPAAMVELEYAARLHDVGKIAVPDEILCKAGPLSPAEWETIRRHPAWGSGILARVPGLEAVAVVVRFHHERSDGWGYPHGLREECIPLGSRIVAVCDAYDAMVADRPYRRARTHEAALDELWSHSGTQFDPDVVEAFTASVA